MSKYDGVYIVYWVVDNQKVYTAVCDKAIDVHRRSTSDCSQLNIFSKGPFFKDFHSVNSWAKHLHNKYNAKHGVINLGELDTDPPVNAFNYLKQKDNTTSKASFVDENIFPEKFWMIHSLTGVSPTTRYLEKYLAEKEAYRLAASYPGTKYFLVETILMVESKLRIKDL